MTNLVKKEDLAFIARFLTVYKTLSEENQNIVLAFIQGLECRRIMQMTDPVYEDQKARPIA